MCKFVLQFSYEKIKNLPVIYIATSHSCANWTAFVFGRLFLFMKYIINGVENQYEYCRIHLWIKQNYGLAKKCCFCDGNKAKRFEWALKKGCEYERNIDNYIQLCPSCHRKYDYKIEYSENRVRKLNDNPNYKWGKYLPNLKGKDGGQHPAAKAILRISEDGTVKRYTSLTEACKEGGFKIGVLRTWLNKIRTPRNKYKWEYEK